MLYSPPKSLNSIENLFSPGSPVQALYSTVSPHHPISRHDAEFFYSPAPKFEYCLVVASVVFVVKSRLVAVSDYGYKSRVLGASLNEKKVCVCFSVCFGVFRCISVYFGVFRYISMYFGVF